MIHRDVKPPKVWVTTTGRAKLIDFGIAKVRSLTRRFPKTVDFGDGNPPVGTPEYCAPEVFELEKGGQGKIDPQTDLYAFGIMLYEVMRGELPVVGDMKTQCTNHCFERLPAIDDGRPDLAAFEPIYRTLVAKEKKERFQTAGEVLAALQGLDGPATSAPVQSPDTRQHAIAPSTFMAYGASTPPGIPAAAGSHLPSSEAPDKGRQAVPPPPAPPAPETPEVEPPAPPVQAAPPPTYAEPAPPPVSQVMIPSPPASQIVGQPPVSQHLAEPPPSPPAPEPAPAAPPGPVPVSESPLQLSIATELVGPDPALAPVEEAPTEPPPRTQLRWTLDGVEQVLHVHTGCAATFGRQRQPRFDLGQGWAEVPTFPLRYLPLEDPDMRKASRETISRVHLALAVMPQGVFLTDRSSLGTWIDGTRLPKDVPTPVSHGQEIGVGPGRLAFRVQVYGNQLGDGTSRQSVLLRRLQNGEEQGYLILAGAVPVGSHEQAAIRVEGAEPLQALLVQTAGGVGIAAFGEAPVEVAGTPVPPGQVARPHQDSLVTTGDAKLHLHLLTAADRRVPG